MEHLDQLGASWNELNLVSNPWVDRLRKDNRLISSLVTRLRAPSCRLSGCFPSQLSMPPPHPAPLTRSYTTVHAVLNFCLDWARR